MRLLCCLVTVAALSSGCENEPPFLRDLKYTPNAALKDVETSIGGSVAYTDVDNDISQWVVELFDPTGVVTVSPRTPIENVGQGVTGLVNFTIKFTPAVIGAWRFNVFIIDLADHQSNKLDGVIKVN